MFYVKLIWFKKNHIYFSSKIYVFQMDLILQWVFLASPLTIPHRHKKTETCLAEASLPRDFSPPGYIIYISPFFFSQQNKINNIQIIVFKEPRWRRASALSSEGSCVTSHSKLKSSSGSRLHPTAPTASPQPATPIHEPALHPPRKTPPATRRY